MLIVMMVARWVLCLAQLFRSLWRLRSDARAGLCDKKVQAAWRRFLADKAVSQKMPRLQEECEAVEEAVKRLTLL